ncbi:uncharacterized protein LOC100820984 [Brachypodium distachyon]|uniref:Uncharacterized protein n=1 Tax=Brachypodium distachyon TaxID=15368 RepID=A0A0Q3GN67_BRADI|nr:uncharacterized protein LOC100820984 [Brachypodium distachyon]KQK12479.2 hypothetical protein BRADI_1g03965v3 [Brachypodium distachyon]|eukprot:XP_003563765.1 uncharacterized protein LOC100820984 [Brachypodium distachyon]
MAMLRSAIGIALRRSATVSRFFSSVSQGCSEAAAAVRRPALASRGFTNGGRGSPGCRDITGSKMSSYASGGSKGNEGGSSSKVFQQQDSTWWNVLFCGIGAGVMLTVQHKVGVQQDEKWKRDRTHKTETPSWMMDKEKAENVVNSWTRC